MAWTLCFTSILTPMMVVIPSRQKQPNLALRC